MKECRFVEVGELCEVSVDGWKEDVWSVEMFVGLVRCVVEGFCRWLDERSFGQRYHRVAKTFFYANNPG